MKEDCKLHSFPRLVNESLQMLARYPELNTKILPLMEDYLVALRYRMENKLLFLPIKHLT